MGVEKFLSSFEIKTYRLDGDDLRKGLNNDLGFSKEDRKENVRRTAQVSKLFADCGVIAIVSLISPFAEDRQFAKDIHKKESLIFLECFVDTPIETCEARDTKGLYKKARAGEIKGLTGIDAIYETPQNPDLILKTVDTSVEECVNKVINLLIEKNIIFAKDRLTPIELFAPSSELENLKIKAQILPNFEISFIDLQWVQVLVEGWATPLKGFMNEREYLECLHFGCLLKSMFNFYFVISKTILIHMYTHIRNFGQSKHSNCIANG